VRFTRGCVRARGPPPAPGMTPGTWTPPPMLVNCRQFRVVGVGHGLTAMIPSADGPAGGEISAWQTAPLGAQAAAGRGVAVGVGPAVPVGAVVGVGLSVPVGR